MPNWSSDDIARIIISVGQSMGITPRGLVIGLATGLVESNLTVYANAKVPGSLNLPHDAVGSDGFSVGVQQQQVVSTDNGWWWGPVEVCQDPTSSTKLFFTRLARLDYNNTSNSPGSYAQAVQGSAFPDRYDQRMGDAQALYDSLSGSTPAPAPEAPVTDPNRPAYNEFAIWDNNEEDRAGTKVDLFLLHTQEPAGYDPSTPPPDNAAESLANYFNSPDGVAAQVSYDYTISQASDGGVTLVDCVNTDFAAWSVGSANLRSINLCFAGSTVNWTREEWLKFAGNAIDVAAYVAVQDCKKYGISTLVVPPPYTAGTPGISDHYYVTKVLGWGSHTDVGPNFPWDVLAAAVSKYAALDNEQPAPPPPAEPPVTPAPVPPAFQYPSTDEMVKQIWEQLFGYQATGFPSLFGKTADGSRGKFPVEGLGDCRAKLLGTNDLPKEGAL